MDARALELRSYEERNKSEHDSGEAENVHERCWLVTSH
jgi:hypothetical protein